MTITRSELIERIADADPSLPIRDIEVGVRMVIEYLAQTLVEGDRVEIRGFGSFAVYLRPPRQARNPRTGEALALGPRRAVHFKPGKELREALQQAAAPGSRKTG
jgi:integration host factor subunit beta